MGKLTAVVLLAVSLLAGTALAEVPWKRGLRGDDVRLPRYYLGFVGVGAQAGCHYLRPDGSSAYPEGVFPAALRLTVLECRGFKGRLGAGISLLDCTFDPRWFSASDPGHWPSLDLPPVYTVGVPSLTVSYVTGGTSRLFHYATLQLDGGPFWEYDAEDFLHVPSLSYTLVAFPPLPIEGYARVGLVHAAAGIKVGAGWWWMQDD